MNSKELVSAALAGRPVPRIPTGPLAVHFCAAPAGYTLRQYSTQASALADSVIRYYERFRPDAVWISADTWVSAEAMGAKVGVTDKHQPMGGMGGPIIRTRDDVDRLPPPDVANQGRYPLMLEALEHVVRKLGREVFVVACFDQYPFSLASALMGLEEAMLAARDRQGTLTALMERCEEYAVCYGSALAQAGADLLSGGDSPAGLLGPHLYESIALPAQKRVVARLKARTGKPVSLHVCGRATPVLRLMAATGADVLELDHAVDLEEAASIVGPNVTIWGNLDPVGILAQGSPADVRQSAQDAIRAIQRARHPRFVLSSGCALAVETPAANLEALLDQTGQLPA